MSGLIINPYAFATGGGGGSYDQYGITTVGTVTTIVSNVQVGWEFTVGGSDLEVGKVRAQLGHQVTNETVRIWRVSDSSLIASAELTPVTGTWVEVDLSSAVTLVSGSNYIVTTRATNGANRTYRFRGTDTTGFAFAPELSYVTSRFLSGDGFPTSTIAGVFGLADIVFAAP
jgi:hypothetical protein